MRYNVLKDSGYIEHMLILNLNYLPMTYGGKLQSKKCFEIKQTHKSTKPMLQLGI